MGSGPHFSKLKKAIKQGSTDEMVNSMFNLGHRSDKAKTVGENILFETKRAVNQLNGGKPTDLTPKVKIARLKAKTLAEFIWDKNPEEASKALRAVEEVKEQMSKVETSKVGTSEGTNSSTPTTESVDSQQSQVETVSKVE